MKAYIERFNREIKSAHRELQADSYIDSLGLYSENYSFVASNKVYFGWKYEVSLEYVRKIVELLPPDGETNKLTWDHREIVSHSPFLLSRKKGQIEICYTSVSGYDVNIKTAFGLHIVPLGWKEVTPGRYNQFDYSFEQRIATLMASDHQLHGYATWAGDYSMDYCPRAKDREAFDNWILNGYKKDV